MPQPRRKPTRSVKENVQARPAGSTAAVTSLLVLVLSWFDVALSATDAAIIIGGLTSLASMVLTKS
jgi:hypothetical protein